uniref:Ig-like domain-containing protein n=1 Tax=Astyanax mexicanus TaxID=7994 RepID=A0A3B1J1M6_ASTMX
LSYLIFLSTVFTLCLLCFLLSEVLHVKGREGNVVILPCGKLSKGNVTWSREINGQKVDILNNNNGQVTRYSAGSDGRYSSGGNLWLNIFRVSQSDAGRYYCNGETVELTLIGNGNKSLCCTINESLVQLRICTPKTTPEKQKQQYNPELHCFARAYCYSKQKSPVDESVLGHGSFSAV